MVPLCKNLWAKNLIAMKIKKNVRSAAKLKSNMMEKFTMVMAALGHMRMALTTSISKKKEWMYMVAKLTLTVPGKSGKPMKRPSASLIIAENIGATALKT